MVYTYLMPLLFPRPEHPIGVAYNLRLYGWIKIFSKRVYLPLTAIYLVAVGHLNLAQIGALVSIAAITSIAADIPTGYFADRVKRKTSIAIGAVLLAIAALIYVLFPSFAGGIAAVMGESIGFSFISGAGEALMHDTLVAMGQVKNYVKVMGRAQSFGLVGNILLVGLVPMTYTINKRLPFVCGVIAASVLAYAATTLIEPPREKPAHLTGNIYSGLVLSLRSFINRYTVLLFLAYGLITAFYTVYGTYVNLVYKNLGIDIGLIGLIYSASSIVGAIGGWYAGALRKIPFRAYVVFDVFMASITMVAIGVTRNLWVAVIMGLLNMGFWRLRSIMYQDKLLKLFGTGGHKATLISALDFFDDINEIWLPVLFVRATTGLGYYIGFTVLGITAFVVLTPLFLVAITILNNHPHSRTQPA